MTINLLIERLVLEGLPLTAREHDRVVNGLKAELARLFERNGVPDSYLSGQMAPTLSAGLVRTDTLDRYAACCGNFVLVVPRRAVPAREARQKILANQPRALPGYQGQSPWLVEPTALGHHIARAVHGAFEP